MFKKLSILLLAFVFVTSLVSTTLAQPPKPPASEQKPGETRTSTGDRPGESSEVLDQKLQQPLEGKTLKGMVKKVDTSKKTATIELMEDYGNKKKGQEMTFNLADSLVGPGRSLEDLKRGAVLEFQVEEANGKHVIQAFGPPTAGGGEQGRGAGQAGQQQQGQQPAQQGPPPSSQPGQEKKQY